jgi:hypothetical protein
MERFPYRYVEDGVIELNGKPDYRIQKFNEYTRRYNDMYLCDNSIQFDCALEVCLREGITIKLTSIPTFLILHSME